MSGPESDSSQGNGLLEIVSDQFAELARSVPEDVARNRDDASGQPGGGFVAYSLKDGDGRPLKDTTTEDAGLSIDDLRATDGFARLKDRCDTLQLHLRIDLHYYASGPREARIYRVVVDGWP